MARLLLSGPLSHHPLRLPEIPWRETVQIRRGISFPRYILIFSFFTTRPINFFSLCLRESYWEIISPSSSLFISSAVSAQINTCLKLEAWGKELHLGIFSPNAALGSATTTTSILKASKVGWAFWWAWMFWPLTWMILQSCYDDVPKTHKHHIYHLAALTDHLHLSPHSKLSHRVQS